jgi:hypothetical protein
MSVAIQGITFALNQKQAVGNMWIIGVRPWINVGNEI